ncbi:MAG: citrate/2-methylcitrate synthase [Anaerolineae bacterium]|jgi:citrate synthase|nr:citrate/2-methylcitrate synthase [Anaerolineae bacterium]
MYTRARASTTEADTARLREIASTPSEVQTTAQGGSTSQPIHEGLAGVVIGSSAICDVNGERGTLTYRGYDIGELACHATFEETVHLLWHGDLPNQTQLDLLSARLADEREISEAVEQVLAALPEHIQPMDALRTASSALSCPSNGDSGSLSSEQQAICLVAKLPTIAAAHYRRRRSLPRVHPRRDLSHAANFLYMIHGEEPTERQAKTMDLAMLLMAEHGFNASTFAARVTAATLADIVSAVTSAISTLKGPLHGGANEQAMRMMLEIGDVAHVASYIDDALARKQRIMGFGHRVYRTSADPRAAYLRGSLFDLCAESGDFHLYELATTIAEAVETKKGLYPNVDFYAAPVLYLLGIPLELFVSVFAISRVPGWTAHIMEQHTNNKLIRPLSAYVGPEDRVYRPIGQRGN